MKIMLGINEFVQCEDFIYLGGVISQDSTRDKDVARRIGFSDRNCQKPWYMEGKGYKQSNESTLVPPDLDPVSYFLQLRNLDTEGRTQA